MPGPANRPERALDAGDAIEGSLRIALDALESRLRRDSDRRVRVAMQLQVCRLMGLKRDEIQAQLKITRDEYARAWRDLRDATRPGADET